MIDLSTVNTSTIQLNTQDKYIVDLVTVNENTIEPEGISLENKEGTIIEPDNNEFCDFILDRNPTEVNLCIGD